MPGDIFQKCDLIILWYIKVYKKEKFWDKCLCYSEPADPVRTTLLLVQNVPTLYLQYKYCKVYRLSRFLVFLLEYLLTFSPRLLWTPIAVLPHKLGLWSHRPSMSGKTAFGRQSNLKIHYFVRKMCFFFHICHWNKVMFIHFSTLDNSDFDIKVIKYVCMYKKCITGKWLCYQKNPSKAVRVQWHPCTLPIGINTDVSLTWLTNIYDNYFYKDNQSPPNTKGVLGHWVLNYYGGGSVSIGKKLPTTLRKQTNSRDIQIKVRENFDQPRLQSTNSSLNSRSVWEGENRPCDVLKFSAPQVILELGTFNTVAIGPTIKRAVKIFRANNVILLLL